jgi:hypothetical protein
MKKDELKSLCKEREIKGITGKSKEELIKMITQRDATTVSAPKIDAETDVKLKVKVEMTDNYSSILQKALDSTIVDTTRLTEKRGDVCIKGALDIISNNISKSWAPFKAITASVIAKIIYPDWDTRKHQIQIGGLHSLRTIDRCHVSDYLYKKELYDTPTEFALTRSFEKAEPYDKNYTGNIEPKESKSAFLNLVDIINTKIDINLLNDILVYLMTFLKNRKEATTSLKNSTVESSKELDLRDVSKLLNEINKFGSGSSVIPVIIAHTLLSVIQPYLWVGITMKPLKEHTAPDNHSKSCGDIEGIDSSSKTKIAIEVKHKIRIDESIIMVFDRKTKDEDIPLKFIITTAKAERKVVQNNICIDTLNGFVISYLQQALFHEKTICLLFIKELRTQIVSYKNMSVTIKESINEILTSLLV